jgi:aminopeptidase N
VESDELPNALLRATVDGFHQPEHLELVRPYVGRYLEAIPRLWAERTTDTAKTIIVRLFPRLLADAEVAEMIRSWLNDAELPPAPHRLIVEGLSDMERALRAQARDRTAGQAARRH